MARVILGVTGSVAAVRSPALHAMLCAAGHDVRIVATRRAQYFFDASALVRPGAGPGASPADRFVFLDNDEWPKPRYERGDKVLHIEFRKWADMLIIAPLDANSLAKFALGLADNFLTSIFRAWDFSKPVVLAPAMNTLMWESPVTLRQLKQLLEDHAQGPVPHDFALDDAPALFASHAPGIVLVPPQAKRLACGDVGTGAMAEVTEIAGVVLEWSARNTPLIDETLDVGDAPHGPSGTARTRSSP
jgi:phosphopantothenoylcysteine decarboxylase